MKKIIFVTKNESKLRDAQGVFTGGGVEILGGKIELPEIQSIEQEEVVIKKGEFAYGMLKTALFVDDTAFFIDGYNKFPGTLTKYINKTLGLRGLIRLYEEGQKAYFLTKIYFRDNENIFLSNGILKGRMTKKISSTFNEDTPISSIFIPDGHGSPLIELDADTVGNIHRKMALNKLYEKLGYEK